VGVLERYGLKKGGGERKKNQNERIKDILALKIKTFGFSISQGTKANKGGPKPNVTY